MTFLVPPAPPQVPRLFLFLRMAALAVGALPLPVLAQRVGIGTPTPSQALDVNGQLRVRGVPRNGIGTLMGVAPDGTLQARPIQEAAPAASPVAPASLGAAPTDGNASNVAVSADGTRAYVIAPLTSKLQAFDVSGNGRLLNLGAVPVAGSPAALALSPDGTRAYVAYANNGSAVQTFSLNEALPASLGTVALGIAPTALAVNAAGTRLYVVSGSARTLRAYALADVPTALGSATTIVQPTALALHPAGTRAYVLSAGQLETFDLSSDVPTSLGAVATIGGQRLVVDAAGTRAYVTTGGGGTLQVVDLSGSGLPTSLGTVAAGTTPLALALHPDGTRAYVADLGAATLYTFDVGGTGLPVPASTTATGSAPLALALNPAGTRAYVANFGNSTLQAFVVGTDPPLLGVSSTGALGPLDAASLPGAGLLPQAYGQVGATGADFGSTGNYTLTRTGVGTYRLRFAAAPLSTADLANAVLTATLAGDSAGLLSYNGGPGYLDIFTFDPAGAAADRGFSFSLYRP